MKEKWNLANCGFDYNVVAVFGSQSTGKSEYFFFFFFFFFFFVLKLNFKYFNKIIWTKTK